MFLCLWVRNGHCVQVVTMTRNSKWTSGQYRAKFAMHHLQDFTLVPSLVRDARSVSVPLLLTVCYRCFLRIRAMQMYIYLLTYTVNVSSWLVCELAVFTMCELLSCWQCNCLCWQGFFRRMLKEQLHKKFICTNGEQCEIASANRTNCKFCRFAKCLRVGMTLEGLFVFVTFIRRVKLVCYDAVGRVFIATILQLCLV